MRGWTWGLFFLVGCSAYDSGKGSEVSTTFESDPDSGDSSSDTSSTPLPDTDLYSIHVDFSLVYGVWAPEPLVRVDLYGAEVELACSQTPPVLSVVEETPPDGEPIVAWWLVELGEGVSQDPCSPWPARSWRIGLGAYDVRLDPAMAARDLLGYDVYGLYLQETPGDPIFVIGIAGTAEMLAGTPDLTVETPPLADGDYSGFSLIALTLDEE